MNDYQLTPLTASCYKRAFDIDLPDMSDTFAVPIKLNHLELEGFNGVTAFTIGIPECSAAALIHGGKWDETYLQVIIRGACEAEELLQSLESLCAELRSHGVITPVESREKREAHPDYFNEDEYEAAMM